MPVSLTFDAYERTQDKQALLYASARCSAIGLMIVRTAGASRDIVGAARTMKERFQFFAFAVLREQGASSDAANRMAGELAGRAVAGYAAALETDRGRRLLQGDLATCMEVAAGLGN
jgi:hypothetical protein